MKWNDIHPENGKYTVISKSVVNDQSFNPSTYLSIALRFRNLYIFPGCIFCLSAKQPEGKKYLMEQQFIDAEIFRME